MNETYLHPNIDSAIVVTQYDLRGFAHPLGFRVKKEESPKCFSVIPENLICLAAGCGGGKDSKSTDPAFVSPIHCSFDECLAMCQQLAGCCNFYEREAIELIIQDIISQAVELKHLVTSRAVEPSHYILSLDKDNWWGKIVLALAEAFGIPVH